MSAEVTHFGHVSERRVDSLKGTVEPSEATLQVRDASLSVRQYLTGLHRGFLGAVRDGPIDDRLQRLDRLCWFGILGEIRQVVCGARPRKKGHQTSIDRGSFGTFVR